MPEFWINDGTALRKAKELWFNDGTAVRNIKEAWYNDGTAVRKVFSSFSAQAFAAFDIWAQSSFGTGTKTATCTFYADGTYTGTGTPNSSGIGDVSGNWGTPTTAGAGSTWSIRVNVTSGSFTTSNTANAWVSLASGWTGTRIQPSGAGSVVFNVLFSPDGGTTTALTVTGCTLRADSNAI